MSIYDYLYDARSALDEVPRFLGALGGVISAMGPVLLIAFILALCVAIFFLPRHNRGKFASPVLAKLYSFLNFESFGMKGILKVLFATLAIYLFIMGLYVMFALSFWIGLFMLISILLVRVVFELAFSVVSIRDNVEQINRRMAGETFEDNEEPGILDRLGELARRPPKPAANAVPPVSPVPVDQIKTADDAKFCPNCGAELRPGGLFCASCGVRVQQPEQQ